MHTIVKLYTRRQEYYHKYDDSWLEDTDLEEVF